MSGFWSLPPAFTNKLPYYGSNYYRVGSAFSNEHALRSRSTTTVSSLPNKLPILEAVYQEAIRRRVLPNFKNTVFVCGQHLLGTTVNLFEFMMKCGAEPRNIFVVGKPYSNNKEVFERLRGLGIQCQPNSQQTALGEFSIAYDRDIMRMWDRCLIRLLQQRKNTHHLPPDNMIVLDDGGHVLNLIPEEASHFCNNKVIGIEQTASGVDSAEITKYPTINVAKSAVKSWIEPHLVARVISQKILQKLGSLKFYSDKPMIGIVGLGYMGQAVAMSLIENGYKNFVFFDQVPRVSEAAKERISLEKDKGIHVVIVRDMSILVNSADVIIGCTGEDVTAGLVHAFEPINLPKYLFSCSSKDIEFKSLLTYIQKTRKGVVPKPPYDDIEFQNGFKAPIKISRGGFPINFDNGEHSVPAKDIQIIRALNAAALIQAYDMLKNPGLRLDNYCLDPDWQRFVVSTWSQDREYPEEEMRKWTNESEIRAASMGSLYSFSSASSNDPTDSIERNRACLTS